MKLGPPIDGIFPLLLSDTQNKLKQKKDKKNGHQNNIGFKKEALCIKTICSVEIKIHRKINIHITEPNSILTI